MNKKLIESFVGVINAEFSMLALPALKKDFEVAFQSHFEKLDKNAKIPEFKKFRAAAKAAVNFDGLNARQKNTVTVRLWRAGKLIGVKLGKTPVKKTGKPPRNPPPPPIGNNGESMLESLAESLGARAPKEREAAWRQMAQLIKEKTGWKFKRFIEEVGPVFKEVLG